MAEPVAAKPPPFTPKVMPRKVPKLKLAEVCSVPPLMVMDVGLIGVVGAVPKLLSALMARMPPLIIVAVANEVVP